MKLLALKKGIFTRLLLFCLKITSLPYPFTEIPLFFQKLLAYHTSGFGLLHHLFNYIGNRAIPTALTSHCTLNMVATESILTMLQADFETLGLAYNAIRDYITDKGESYIVSHSDRTHY